MNSFAIPPLISAIVFLCIGLVTFFRSQSAAKLPFTMLCVLTVTWQLSWTVLFNVNDPDYAYWIIKVGYAGIIFLPIVYVHFVIRFCREPLGFIKWSYAAATAFLLFHLFSDWFISGHYSYFWGYYPKAGILHPAYLLLVTVSFLASTGPLIRYWRSCVNENQLNQFKYVSLAYVLYFFAAIDFAVNYGFEFYPPGFLFILLSIAIVAYAIARHEVLDINFVVKKSIVYSALLVLLIVPCAALIYLSENFVPTAAQFYTHTSLLIIVGFVFPRIKVRAERNLENLLFGGEVKYRKAFEKLSQKLVRLQKIDDLLDDMVKTIALTLDTDSLCIYLAESGEGNFVLKAKYGNPIIDKSTILNKEIHLESVSMEGNTYSLNISGIKPEISTIPIVFEKTLLGFLAIHRSSISKTDSAVYQAMTNQLAVAINNSLQFEEIRELNLNLEQKVAERTKALSAAYDELKGLSALKDQFFSRISHELRTPLTNIILPIQAKLEDLGPRLHPENREEKVSILRNAYILLKQINEILDLAKSEAGQNTVKVVECDITKILQDVVLSATLAAKRSGISINFLVHSPYFLYVDADKVERIATNLLSNAIKYTPQGGEINIFIEDFSDNLKISISDTGIGIDASDLPHIFKVFHQVKDHDSNYYQGTGLGLAICKEFMDLHHGHISATSKPGRGSTFSLEFLKGKSHFSDSEITKTEEWPNTERRAQERRVSEIIRNAHNSIWENELSGASTTSTQQTLLPSGTLNSDEKRILVVEDNRDLSKNIVQKLSQRYLVEAASNGQEGLDKIAQFKPDIILSDVMMPVMDGFTMCQKIKSNADTQDIPVVLITAKQSTKDKVEGFGSGADQYIMKPFDFNELHAVLRSMLVKKEYQSKIKLKNIELEKTKVDLEHAIVASNDANEAKSRFLASMSHELRTPLNAIIGYSELLSEEADEFNLNESVAKDIERISVSGKHLLSLINNVLDLAKIESGKMNLYLEEFDIVKLINDIETLLTPLANKNNNHYSINFDQSIGKMFADETKVRQIILNLLSNACKFTKNGSIGLEISEVNNYGKSEIKFSVSDSGIGMAKEQIDSLFDEYAQADRSTSKNFGGTGLGLAISRHFCKLMGGNIEVHSQLQQGTCFIVHLPRIVKETTSEIVISKTAI